MVADRHLTRAFELAHRSPNPHPNPRVGAVIVDTDGRVVSEANHIGPGHPHAEIVALNAAGELARDSTVYVSLEPCSHQGRTGPCTEALVAAGIARVVIGIEDPDSQVSGRGIAHLREQGIEVLVASTGEEARQVDPAYFRHRESGMPMVTLKWAMTLDGSVAAADGSSQWITSDSARQYSHELRAQSDAVIVGAGTLRRDDPLLTARSPTHEDGVQPVPVIVAGSEPLPPDRRIWERQPLVISTQPIELPGGELVQVGGEDGLPDPIETCRELADRGLIQLLVEGGPGLSGAWWDAGVITNGVVWLGAKIGGGTGLGPISGIFANMSDADVVSIESVRIVGGDVVITFGKT